MAQKIPAEPPLPPALRELLTEVESFISGFEDDPMQEGIGPMLDKLRAQLGMLQGECAQAAG